MGFVNRDYDTLKLRFDEDICFIQLHRPAANNAINDRLVEELGYVLRECEGVAKVVVLEGSPEVFCSGADFREIGMRVDSGSDDQEQGPGPLYDVWQRLACGPFVTLAHVRGRANAGGIGFVAACDIVVCDSTATFSLSELLFGLMPACVLPFLIRRVGFAKANYMTLMTQPVGAAQAMQWGLVDALTAAKPKALAANIEVFSDPANRQKIARYARTGKFPWEPD